MALLHPETWPVIDYRAHPAFAGRANARLHGTLAARFEQDVEGLVLAANQALRERHSATERLGQPELQVWLESSLERPLEELRRACGAALPGRLGACVDTALRGVLEDARAEAIFRNTVAGRQGATVGPAARRALADLRSQSISVGRIDEREIAAIVADLRSQMAIVEHSDTARRGVRSWRTLARAGRYWTVLTRALEACGFPEATNAFYGCEMELLSSSLVYSHDREVWWRDCYADCGVPTSPAAYFHHDQDWHQIKAVVYLSPATRATGAFSYIEGGQHFRAGNVLSHFYFHLVHALGRAAAKANAGSASYYRRAFTDPALRADFAELPRVLQGATHFGDDLHADDPQTAPFLARERVVESSAGNVVLFNGSDLFHRGGLVQQGERWSLQLMFGPRAPLREQLRTRAQHLALVAASRAIGWPSVDRLRALRRSTRAPSG